jgi:hypothetical protein
VADAQAAADQWRQGGAEGTPAAAAAGTQRAAGQAPAVAAVAGGSMLPLGDLVARPAPSTGGSKVAAASACSSAVGRVEGAGGGGGGDAAGGGTERLEAIVARLRATRAAALDQVAASSHGDATARAATLGAAAGSLRARLLKLGSQPALDRGLL